MIPHRGSFSTQVRSTIRTVSAPILESPYRSSDPASPQLRASHAYTERAVSAIRALVIAFDIHKVFDPIDVVRASIGANVATSPDWQHSAKRLVDTLIIGSCQTTYAGLGSSESSL